MEERESILATGRAAVWQRIRGANPDEKREFVEMDPGQRLRWVVDWLSSRYVGFTRMAQAARVCIAPQTLSNVYTGTTKHPRHEVLIALATDMGLPTYWVFLGQDDQCSLTRSLPEDVQEFLDTGDQDKMQYIVEGIRIGIRAKDAGIGIEVLRTLLRQG